MQQDLRILMEQSEPQSIGIDSFKGSVKEFRLYLLAQRKLLEVGIIA